jgi:tRNA dimethylallyltransferase
LSLSKETQKKLIEDRVKKRIRDGAIDEVKQLLASNPNPNLPLFSGLGVKEIRLFLNQGISQEELVRLWTKSEIDYARRQMVWFNKQPSIIWYDESKDRDALAHGLANILIKK